MLTFMASLCFFDQAWDSVHNCHVVCVGVGAWGVRALASLGTGISSPLPHFNSLLTTFTVASHRGRLALCFYTTEQAANSNRCTATC